ncbi:ABC-2 type transport system permease protein [Nocardia farcinica]|uniref:Doxorubicin resistance ABC transporter permease protein drrB n=1 Tax=Nocardia farcinica TaxID=37329 RepID=A0A0H5P9P5_NOCFR|nr:ABC transporter permease [Nocardia farcinica]AXK88449.1 antibiotic transporter [Nocardia farcinica]MBF6250775.1 ABC transporter permease [Nocardia farcinica]MBF6360450.1 ABC transporter permease [Nocardia farcinica]MBF6375233.1 ABC transporter permease [Nocardia farcinica]PFX00568.1 Doxorubicin resistance ABC transporter permease protein DrrB [Nocardia farcinica]
MRAVTDRTRLPGDRRRPAHRATQPNRVVLPSRPHPSAAAQWWTLTARLLRPSLRNGEVLTAVLAPTVFTLGFYVPMNAVMAAYGHGLSSYAQFLLPMIVMQAVAFCAVSAAHRAAVDARAGLDERLRTLPLPRLVPPAARLAAALYRGGIAGAAALVCGGVIGARFFGPWWQTGGFLLLALAVGAVLSLGADLLGSLSAGPEATTQLLALPQLILGLVSTGLAPAEHFPPWLAGFAAHQPVSAFVDALRALAGDATGAAGTIGWSTLGPAVAWILGLAAVFGAGAVFVASRGGR